jgi:hypothetical protein
MGGRVEREVAAVHVFVLHKEKASCDVGDYEPRRGIRGEAVRALFLFGGRGRAVGEDHDRDTGGRRNLKLGARGRIDVDVRVGVSSNAKVGPGGGARPATGRSLYGATDRDVESARAATAAQW